MLNLDTLLDCIKEELICKDCSLPMDHCVCEKSKHEYSYKSGGCVKCGQPFNTNGTSPQNNYKSKIGRFFGWLLIKFIRLWWFNRWVDDISNEHDIDCWEGFSRKHKDRGDAKMHQNTLGKISSTWWLRPKKFWKKRAMINYLAVKHGGDSSFNWYGCSVKTETFEKT